MVRFPVEKRTLTFNREINDKMKLRFPPSPTGHLHVGNVRTALYNWLLAKKSSGQLVLRIEDTDRERSTRENEERLIQDLKWLGIDWQEGPEVGGDNGPYRQSERGEIYQELIDKLLAEGKAYYCFCTPEELEADRQQALAEKRPPIYQGKYRDFDPEEAKKKLAAGEEATIRFRVEEGEPVQWDDLVHGKMSIERETIGDFIFVRSDGTPSYNFAVVVDDALMGMTHVLRGDDHISNTPRQILLYQAMGFELPQFGHLPMILGPDGSRLSKRHGATSVEEFRLRGYLPDALINFLAFLGWNPGDEKEIFSREELIQAFSVERVNKAAAIFNFEKLDWLNGQYMRSTPTEELFEHVKYFLNEKGILAADLNDELKEWYISLVDTFNSGSSLTEIAEGAMMAFEFDPEKEFASEEAKEVLAEESAKTVLTAFAEELGKLDPKDKLDAASFKAATKAVQKSTGIKGKHLFHPVRLAVTAKTSGPELGKLVPLLEKGMDLPLPATILGVRERVAKALEVIG